MHGHSDPTCTGPDGVPSAVPEAECISVGEENLESDVETLALLRAESRVDSWCERTKSPWLGVSLLAAIAGFTILPLLWVSAFDADPAIGLRDAIGGTLLAATVGCLLWVGQAAWKRRRVFEYYEMELLELRTSRGK
jgi:hypothetical protein